MKIHNKIRQEIVNHLAKCISEVNHFYNGLPKIVRLEEELPLIAVYLNNAEGRPIVFGNQDIDWFADLMVLTYIPFQQGEEILDDIAEKINQAILFNDFYYFQQDAGYDQSYEYEYDTENNMWVSSALTYRITYNPKRIEETLNV